jgi:RimJ/RimL family protein N-acetyltransferase
MPAAPTVSLRTRTADDLDVLYRMRRIHLQAIASNTAALRSYEKAGFVVEGRLREHAWVRGGYEDIVLMGILRSERTPPA